jgi:hypothetical protein
MRCGNAFDFAKSENVRKLSYESRSGFGREPEPQDERNKGDGADTAEPEQDKP